ncbi:hypothetical protein CERZMDRAFT_85908 [Cercospora zeae-maydis SCOH1-5]|uniref:Uncharacterized protein n=1 Tax=Cercospora zeae-maydis SCOH1-5 TaxID=717836 RepID=A0A6A6FB54_9PEZI|nr:hypothetical protein CERZMDRAFT_85908 [Cercospora zeae-maydis SCOH1-5]
MVQSLIIVPQLAMHRISLQHNRRQHGNWSTYCNQSPPTSCFGHSQASRRLASQQHFEGIQQEAPDKAKLLGVSGDLGVKQTFRTLGDATAKRIGQFNIFVANAGGSQFDDVLTEVSGQHTCNGHC